MLAFDGAPRNGGIGLPRSKSIASGSGPGSCRIVTIRSPSGMKPDRILRSVVFPAPVGPVDSRQDVEEGRFAHARAAQPDDVLALFHVAQRVVKGQETFLIELGLALEGIGFNDPQLGDAVTVGF